MATIAGPIPGDQVQTLNDVSWETYERILAEHDPGRGKRLTYDNGVLHIMVLSLYHEEPQEVLKRIVADATFEWGIDIKACGSMTIKRQDLLKGFEPDGCFYVGSYLRVEGKRELDFTVDPPPDLVIEVDITDPSLSRFPIFAAIGIPEVWRYHGERVSVLNLDRGAYIDTGVSAALPLLNADLLTRFTAMGLTEPSSKWVRELRRWARSART